MPVYLVPAAAAEPVVTDYPGCGAAAVASRHTRDDDPAGTLQGGSRGLLGHAPADDDGFELFRRAIGRRDQVAWAALYSRYRGLVLAWIRTHPAAHGGEDAEYLLNRSFERFFVAVGPERLDAFPGIPQLLRYLKTCVHSVLMDAARARHGTVLEPLGEDDGPPAADVADLTLAMLAGRDLWHAVAGEARDDAERLVARLCLALALPPREVQARHPDQFATVADVYRVKRNLLERLRRNPAVRQCLAATGDGGANGQAVIPVDLKPA